MLLLCRASNPHQRARLIFFIRTPPNNHQSGVLAGVTSAEPGVVDFSAESVARSRLSPTTASLEIEAPNNREETFAMTAARSASSPSVAMVADVPMQIG